jgi:hypothetical protein
MSDTTGYWSRLALLSFTGIYAISLAWSLLPFVKFHTYPSVCSDPGMNPSAEATGEGLDTACNPDTASQAETSRPQNHPSIHHSHKSPEVRESRNDSTNRSDLRFDMQGGADGKEAKHPSLQPQPLGISTAAEAAGIHT